jgi:signal transduction histidine kinase
VSTRNILSRLDWSLFAVRWILLAGVLVLAIAIPALNPAHGDVLRSRLLIATGVGIVVAMSNLALVLWANNSALPGIISMVMDAIYALLLYWASDGMAPLYIAAGMLPVVTGTLRIGSVYGIGAAGVIAAAVLIMASLMTEPENGLGMALIGSASLLSAAVFMAVPIHNASLGLAGQESILKERESEKARLRATREHARAIYEMAATLSATLNYEAVLDAALDVGVLGLREMGPNARLVSAVLLFDENTGQLKIAIARRLTHADVRKQVPGKRGVLGLALKQAEPVFANDARRDPELKYFVAFQDARSILCVPLRAGFDNYGVLLFSSTIPNAFSEEHVELLMAIASQATIALQNATLYQNLVEEKERIMEVEEDARKQLSRDLHDGPTQSVAAIAMRVNYIRRLLEREPEQVPPELQKVEELARKTTKEIRHMLFTLRPLVLETQGLVPALGELVKKMEETHGQNVILQVQEDIEQHLDNNDQSVIFNIVDEAVNNARKHAEAEHIWVRFGRQKDYLVLEIQDDGVGFDIGEVDANYDQRGSLGMINLRERAELLDGTLRIESAEGKGTKVTVIMEVARSHPAEDEAINGAQTGERRSR